MTGSAGHLGEALVRVLRAQGREVVGLDLLSSPFTTVTGPVTDRGVVRRCLDGVGAVLHAATLHKRTSGRLFGDQEAEYARRGWAMFPTIDRVYVNERARSGLGWRPRYVLDRLKAGQDPRSPLARAVGTKGYHPVSTGPYTTR